MPHASFRHPPSMESSPPGTLTHLDSRGAARMVDVADRPASHRAATAEGFLVMAPATLALVVEGAAPKGDVLAVARVAAIQGAKRTAELIPLCHPLPLAGVTVVIEPAADGSGLRLEARVRTTAATGVEMEALTAVQVGLLTLYDMLKAVDPAMTLGPVRVLEKRGGRHGPWRHPAAPARAGENETTSPSAGLAHG
ncbi:MAG: cyclic pyranopterin monophosphate synthase MoaC [Cyanobacteriota bacterium]|nr:cyclic pyranopterin monophosphate synthase MoaC [Cyanobacteriota bacterium]